MASAITVQDRLARTVAILLPVADVLDERAADAEPPAWSERRGWTRFLLALDDRALGACEADGLGAHLPELPGAPPDLVALGREATEAARLPAVARARSMDPACLRAVPHRKQAQLAALLGAVEPMAARAGRIVDVGAGSGHFTRLAAEAFDRAAVGLERRAERVAAAERRLGVGPGAGSATYVTLDADRDALALAGDDLAVGLHACGKLGDDLVLAVAAARCDLALVSCCLQKRAEAWREPLSPLANGLRLRRGVLGLTNLTAQPLGVEATLEQTLRAREVRYALRGLLAARGVVIEPGAEMRGINRRRAHAGLGDVAERACALRGLSPPTASEVRHHEALAATRHARVRRFSLPRAMLARLLEVAIVLDRGACLETRGLAVTVATIFERAVTPRNIGLFASVDPSRLPSG